MSDTMTVMFGRKKKFEGRTHLENQYGNGDTDTGEDNVRMSLLGNGAKEYDGGDEWRRR